MKKITLLTILLLGVATISKAQVTATGSYSVGVGSVIITDVTNDEDNGDGAGDGAKFIDGADGTAIDEAVYFTFDGTIENGATYTLNTTLYNVNTSYCNVTVYLYNKTDGTELTSVVAGVQPFNHAAGDDIKAVELNYTAVATDAGDVLEVRYVKTQAGAYRNYAIDILELNGIAVGPTPPSVLSPAGSWSPIGDTEITNTIDDGDNGDGVSDGAIFVDGLSVAIGQGVAFTFDDTMEETVVYSVVTNVYNPGSSYNKVVVSLYNVTDGQELKTSGVTNLPGGSVAEISISYTALSTDEGDVVELRFVKDFDGNMSRDFSIDNVTVGGSVISTDLSTLSIEDTVLNENVSVYPNPATDILNIVGNDIVSVKNIMILDITGKLVHQGSFTQNLNVSSFPRGLYLLRLESETGGVLVKKIILK